MITFEISINGTPYAESEDLTAVTVVAELIGGRRGERVTVHGQSSEGQLQWLDSNLSIGDEIRIRIVEAVEAAETWERGCSFCAREIPEIERMIQGPKVAICSDCTNRFAESLSHGSALPVGASIHDDPQQPCGFCGKDPRDTGGVIVRNGAAICGECVRICEELVNER